MSDRFKTIARRAWPRSLTMVGGASSRKRKRRQDLAARRYAKRVARRTLREEMTSTNYCNFCQATFEEDGDCPKCGCPENAICDVPGAEGEPWIEKREHAPTKETTTMMTDETETTRRQMVAKQRAEGARDRTALEEEHGQVWNGDQLRCDFEPQSFMAPFIIVRRKKDGVVGTLEYQHEPRLYWDFKEDED